MSNIEAVQKDVDQARSDCEGLLSEISALSDKLDEAKSEALEPRLHIGPNINVNSLLNDNANNLTGVFLNDCALSYEILRTIGEKQTLDHVTISSCSGNLDLELLKSLTHLEWLDISGHTDVKGWHALQMMHSLRYLYLDKAILSDEGVKQISKANGIINLSIQCCLGISDISPLASINTLEFLNAKSCLSLKNIGSLGCLPFLQTLSLSHTLITDDGIRALSESHSIAHLELECCKKITDISPLTNILTLTFLNIGKCSNLIFSSFTGAPLLEVLIMDGTSATDKVVEQISLFRHLREINLARCSAVTDIRPLSRLTALQKLDLCECTHLHQFPCFSDFPALSDLFLVATQLDITIVQAISTSPSIRVLDVQRSNIDDPEVSALAAMSNLNELHLDQWPVSVELLEGLSALQRLTVGGRDVTDAFVEKLSENKQLEFLNLDDCKRLTCATPIGCLSSLKELRLSGCSSLMDISFIKECTMLQKLVLDGSFVSDEMITQLGASTTVAVLELVRCRKLKHISALEVLKTLEELTLAHCENIEDLGSIGQLKGLNCLVLRCINFSPEDLSKISSNGNLNALYFENYDAAISINEIAKVHVRDIRVTDCREVIVHPEAFPEISKKSIILERSGVHKNDKETLVRKGVVII